MKKLLAIILAAIMCCSVLPIAAFATDDKTSAEGLSASAAKTVEAWEANYGIILETLTTNENYAHYKYVVDNSKELQNLMTVYTAFGLYDNAWQNGITKKADKETCKKILMAMIEEYSYDMGHSYVDDIVAGLQTASSVADFVEKLQSYLTKYSDVLDFVASDTWGEVFQVVDVLITLGQTWQNIRTGLIDAYSQILSVQMANGYYIEMLAYVADNTQYAPMQTAATELIEEATTAIEDQIAVFLKAALDAPVAAVVDILVDLALNSNVYTATANSIYSGVTSVADFLWNTGDQYSAFAALVGSYYAETVINDYALASFDKTAENYDAARTMFATYALISVRAFGENSLYNLLEVQSGGVINKIKSKVYNTSCTEYTANIAALELAENAFFKTEITDMAPVEAIAYVYCPVNALVYDNATLLFRVKDGEASEYASQFGMAKVSYCEYNKEYIKVLFLADADYKIVLVGTDDGYVTFVKNVIENGVLNDYSFTELAVKPGTKISIQGKTYTVTDEDVVTDYTLNEEFVQPEGKEVTWETVTEATKEVVVEEANNFFAKIRAFFEKILAAIKSIFTIGG